MDHEEQQRRYQYIRPAVSRLAASCDVLGVGDDFRNLVKREKTFWWDAEALRELRAMNFQLRAAAIKAPDGSRHQEGAYRVAEALTHVEEILSRLDSNEEFDFDVLREVSDLAEAAARCCFGEDLSFAPKGARYLGQ